MGDIFKTFKWNTVLVFIASFVIYCLLCLLDKVSHSVKIKNVFLRSLICVLIISIALLIAIGVKACIAGVFYEILVL